MNLTSSDDPQPSKKPTPLQIFQYDARLNATFQFDCKDFLDKFKKLQDFSFKSFSELWRETRFSAIFKHQKYVLMLQAFLKNCFFILKKFVTSDDPYIQVGAIYLLYSLYKKQPVKNWIKIRITQSEFDKLIEICEIHRANKSLDVVWVVNKMRVDGAFWYCGLPTPLKLQSRGVYRTDETPTVTLSQNDSLKQFKDFVEKDDILTELQKIDEEYQKLTMQYNEKSEQFYVFPTKVVDELKEAYKATTIDPNQEEEKKESDQLQKLKTRAMRNKNATYRGDKRVLSAADLDTPSTSKKR